QAVEDDAALPGDCLDKPGPLQPAPPVTAVARRVDQLSLGQVLRRPTLATIQCRRTNRHQPLIEQPEPLTVGRKITVAQQNRAVERLTVKIHRIHIHPYAGELYPVLWLGQVETLQYLQQPAHGQR